MNEGLQHFMGMWGICGVIEAGGEGGKTAGTAVKFRSLDLVAKCKKVAFDLVANRFLIALGAVVDNRLIRHFIGLDVTCGLSRRSLTFATFRCVALGVPCNLFGSAGETAHKYRCERFPFNLNKKPTQTIHEKKNTTSLCDNQQFTKL